MHPHGPDKPHLGPLGPPWQGGCWSSAQDAAGSGITRWIPLAGGAGFIDS